MAAAASALSSMNAAGEAENSGASTGVENPAKGAPADQWMQLGISEDDIKELVKIAGLYASQWMPDRQLRLRTWTKNVLFYRGLQLIEWHNESGNWVDLLSWYSGSDKVKDGESTELAKFQHPITRMLGQTFISNIASEVPLTQVKPHDARVPSDMQTADAAKDAIGIIERQNNCRQMTRAEAEYLFNFGHYFKMTRGVLDSSCGYDTEPIMGEIVIAQPARMKCLQCGAETPVDKLQGSGDQGPREPELSKCPGCGTGMGPESFYEAGPGLTMLGVTGTRKVPRARVKQSIYSGLEFDCDPQAKDIAGTPIGKLTEEIDVGEARMMFPNAWEKIQEGAEDLTSGIASLEKINRNLNSAVGGAFTTDITQQRPSFSQIWFQPMSYMRTGDKEFAARMMEAAPEGLKLSLLGAEVVGVKKEVLTQVWSCCRLFKTGGIYGQTLAENIVSFNERFNSAMNAYDDYMNRAPFGLNIVNGAKIDQEKTKGNKWAPTTMVPVFLKDQEVLVNCFQHFDIPVNPGLALYPQMLWMFAQLLNGLPAQVGGGGTNPDVETFGGQQMQMGQAKTGLTPFWENIKEEHAEAAQNAIKCLKRLLKCGAIDKLQDVVKDDGSRFTNKTVNAQNMQGEVEFYPDENQSLPTSPDDIRKACMTIFEEVGKNNPAAIAIIDVPANQEIMASNAFPGFVSPTQAQRLKTLKDLATLAEQEATPEMKQDGSIGLKLPVMPSIVEHFDVAIPTVEDYMLDNADQRMKNPLCWGRWEEYWKQCREMENQQKILAAGMQQKVQAAGAPSKPGPDPGTQATIAELHKVAMGLVDQLARLATIDPALTKNTITGQVAAAKEVVDSAVKVQEAMMG